MNLFRLSFILYFLKLLYGLNFWNNLQNDDIDLYRRATLAERLAKKLLHFSYVYLLKYIFEMEVNREFDFRRV